MSTIYFVVCMLVLSVGTIVISQKLAHPGPSIYVEQGPSYPIKVSPGFVPSISRLNEADQFITKELRPGDTFFVYRYYCVDISYAMEIYTVRYLQTELPDGDKIIIPLTQYPLVVTRGKNGNNCTHSLTPLTLNPNASPGNYVIKSYVMFRNIFGITKIIDLDDVPFTVLKNKS